jgi:hypothetical protein
MYRALIPEWPALWQWFAREAERKRVRAGLCERRAA